MEIMNLVVTGTVGAGKTTFIRSVSEIEVVDTERKATDEVANMKKSPTVSMDFGTLQFGDEMALHIYGNTVRLINSLVRIAPCLVALLCAGEPRP